MNIPSFILPRPLGKILSILPGYPQTLLFVHAANLAMGYTLRSEVMRPLQGKLINIHVTDARVIFISLSTATAWSPATGAGNRICPSPPVPVIL